MNYKLTINQAAPTKKFPLPLIEELLTTMSGGKHFSKLDLQDAYLQLPLDTASKQYMAINTHCGLFQYNRLPFGLASAPAIFQRHMETLFLGLDGVSVDLDNILVASCTLDEHLNRLAEILHQLLPPFTPGNGPPSCGADCTLILQDPSWATCF